LTDNQLAQIMAAARPLDPAKHPTFLERVAGHLRQIGFMRVQDEDIDRAIRAAISGLVHEAPAGATGGPWTGRA
jgi:hypothetical protein